ncbi:MAG: hypothetical protein JJE39_13770 [Vicinamibacteria bacterium]|nr:hypothetical protein [Vicinamibacteria bacterium]
MKKSYVGFAAAAALAASTIACGSQEGHVIESFFRATLAKDSQTVSSFAVVQFDEPLKSWKVKSIGEEQRVPTPLGDLAAAHNAAEEAAAQNKRDQGAYFNAHPLEVDTVKSMVENGAAVPAKLQETAAAWKKFMDADNELKGKVSETQGAYDREKRLVTMSTGKGPDADSLVGDLVTKTAIVEVDTGVEVKTYAIQLRKYDVAPTGQATKVMSRWLIQSITPQ